MLGDPLGGQGVPDRIRNRLERYERDGEQR
jgi:hypothetical protein